MKIIKITKQSIVEAVNTLRRGGTVIYPTETAYALGCDATDENAKKRIFKIKNRPLNKNLPMICATKKMATDFFKFGKIEKKLAKKYWPGPFTIILSPCHCERSEAISLFMRLPRRRLLAMTSDGVAVRVSSNKIARALSRGLRRPIISTSANISGADAIYNFADAIKIFSQKKYQPDLILDGGKLPPCPPSTIIKIVDEKIIILRQGEVRLTIPPLG